LAFDDGHVLGEELDHLAKVFLACNVGFAGRDHFLDSVGVLSDHFKLLIELGHYSLDLLLELFARRHLI